MRAIEALISETGVDDAAYLVALDAGGLVLGRINFRRTDNGVVGLEGRMLRLSTEPRHC